MTSISIQEYQEKIGEYYLVDVRTPSEFAEAHIINAKLHPLDTLNVGEIGFKSQGKKILLSCLSGARAAKASQMFTASGHAVSCLEGSLQGWEAAGQPVVRSTPKGIPLIRQVMLTVSTINLTAAFLALFVNPAWTWVIVGTGVGLFIAGATGFCGLGLVLAKMPWNQPSKDQHDTGSCNSGG